MKRGLLLALAAGLLITVSTDTASAQSAMEQLRNMTNGQNHTGTGFDGSSNERPASTIDTTVQGSTSTYTNSSSTSTYSVDTSSGTQSGSDDDE